MTDLAFRYANVDLALKMIESQELWFSDMRHMNDWDEYAAGHRLIRELVEAEHPELANAVDEIAPERMGQEFMGLICSLSAEGDSLSMWRGYGDSGRGVSVGYSTEAIQQHLLFQHYLSRMAPVNSSARFSHVIYDRVAFLDHVRQQIGTYGPSVRHIADASDAERTSTTMRVLRHALARLSLLYKNDFFAEEREVRGFIEIRPWTSGYKLSARPSAYSDDEMPYFKGATKFAGIPAIRSVVLGPRCELSPEGMAACLEQNGLSSVTVTQSRGTYR